MSSFPVPVSPWMSTVLVVGATRATMRYTSSIGAEVPTKPWFPASRPGTSRTGSG
jgi:hypothetical protein